MIDASTNTSNAAHNKRLLQAAFAETAEGKNKNRRSKPVDKLLGSGDRDV